MSRFKSLSMITAIALSSLALPACGLNINNLGKSLKPSGNTETKNYTFNSADISGLDIAAGVKVVYTPVDSAASASVTVQTDEVMMPHVVVELDDRELNIYRKSSFNANGIEINVKITGPALSSWEASSGSELIVAGALSATKEIDIDTSSGAGAKFTDINAPKVSVDVSSGSSAKISGVTAGKLSIDASSGATAEISGIKGSKVSADASSGSTVKLAGWASETSFDTSSGGSIRHSKLNVTQ